MTTNQYNPLFRLASKCLKYFLLALIGFAIACALSMMLGGSSIVITLLPLVGDWVVRLGIILLFFMGTAIVIESWR